MNSETKLLFGPVPPEDFKSDGCTMAPDRLRVNMLLACRYHDWYYYVGKGPIQRKIADTFFFHNLRTLGARLITAITFYAFVRCFGWVLYRKKSVAMGYPKIDTGDTE